MSNLGIFENVPLVFGVYRSFFAVFTPAFKTKNAVNKRKQGIIASASDILAGVNVSSALANQNVSGKHALTIRTFYAKSLRTGVTAVSG
jgi:hypothetical protein